MIPRMVSQFEAAYKCSLVEDTQWYILFVFEALLSIVIVHVQVSDIAKPLVNRTLRNSVVRKYVTRLPRSFSEYNEIWYGWYASGNVLQATLEIEFMHQTLSQYVSKGAQETLQLIYTTIEQLYDTTRASVNLDSELSSVKQL
uniref:Exocyst complex component SEC5 n=1 Tax=Gigaspora margarita TaxID=4874 RepID=A0A8H4A5T4_GIGMA